MKDFANRTSTKKANKRKSVFRSKRKSLNIISSETILSLLAISAGLILTSIFFFKSDVRSFQSGKVSNNIINKVSGINRVVYDISSKPPATIEWE